MSSSRSRLRQASDQRESARRAASSDPTPWREFRDSPRSDSDTRRQQDSNTRPSNINKTNLVAPTGPTSCSQFPVELEVGAPHPAPQPHTLARRADHIAPTRIARRGSRGNSAGPSYAPSLNPRTFISQPFQDRSLNKPISLRKRVREVGRDSYRRRHKTRHDARFLQCCRR